jgi:hypothetical protein
MSVYVEEYADAVVHELTERVESKSLFCSLCGVVTLP